MFTVTHASIWSREKAESNEFHDVVTVTGHQFLWGVDCEIMARIVKLWN